MDNDSIFEKMAATETKASHNEVIRPTTPSIAHTSNENEEENADARLNFQTIMAFIVLPLLLFCTHGLLTQPRHYVANLTPMSLPFSSRLLCSPTSMQTSDQTQIMFGSQCLGNSAPPAWCPSGVGYPTSLGGGISC